MISLQYSMAHIKANDDLVQQLSFLPNFTII